MVAIVLICVGLLAFSPPHRSEYQAASARAGRDAGAHLELAVWCEKKELVHDNSLPPPVLTPFDAEPSLASVAEGHPLR